MDLAHAAHALLGSDPRGLARRAIHEVIDDRMLANLGLRRETSGRDALAWLTVGAVMGVAVGGVAVYFFAENGRAHRERALAWASATMQRALGQAPAEAASADNGTPRRASARPRHTVHS